MKKFKLILSIAIFAVTMGMAAPSHAQESPDVRTTETERYDDDEFNYGWLGLLGLIGLFGLKKKSDVHVHDTTTTQARVRTQP